MAEFVIKDKIHEIEMSPLQPPSHHELKPVGERRVSEDALSAEKGMGGRFWGGVGWGESIAWVNLEMQN